VIFTVSSISLSLSLSISLSLCLSVSLSLCLSVSLSLCLSVSLSLCLSVSLSLPSISPKRPIQVVSILYTQTQPNLKYACQLTRSPTPLSLFPDNKFPVVEAHFYLDVLFYYIDILDPPLPCNTTLMIVLKSITPLPPFVTKTISLYPPTAVRNENNIC
jgi:hypothetical protein